MLERWAPETFPANSQGQIHFARAMMESTARTIRAFLAAEGAALDLDTLTNRFLAWPVPATACADPCASMPGYPVPRTGTNFFTAAEARQMLEYVLARQDEEFATYLAEIDRLAVESGFEGSYTEQTGHECWREGFDDGLSPADAWAEEQSAAAADAA